MNVTVMHEKIVVSNIQRLTPPPPKKKVMLKLADQFCGEGGYFSQRTANQLVIFVRLDRQGGVRHMEVTGINGLEYGIFC
jgi:hypothetical protein